MSSLIKSHSAYKVYPNLAYSQKVIIRILELFVNGLNQ